MKTKEYVLQTDFGFGHGYEDQYATDNRKDIRARYREYLDNQPQFKHRWITRNEQSPVKIKGLNRNEYTA